MKGKPILEKNFNENIDIEKRLRSREILARLFIEIQGNDKEAAKKALERTIFDSLANEKYVTLLNVKFYEIQEEKKGKYSGVVEIKSLFRDFRWFVSVIMRYGPSAIEIIEPESYTLSLDEMQSLIIDVSEFSQTFSSQILTLLKDKERVEIYKKFLGNEEKKQ